MKYYKYLLLIFLTVLFFKPCSSQNIVKLGSDKQAYIAYIFSLPDAERKKQLETDAAEIDSMRTTASNWWIYYSFSISSGSSKPITQKDAAPPFTIAVEADVLSEFQQLDNNSLSAEQLMSLPNSVVKIHGPYRFNYIEDSYVSYNPKQFFVGSQSIPTDKIGLQKLDSVCVAVSCTYPTSFDTLRLSRNQSRKITYKGDSLSVRYGSKRKNTLSIKYPLGMPLLGYQAISDNGILMNSISNSNFPVYSLKPDVANLLKQTSDVLNKAALANDKSACEKYLEEIPEDAGKYIARVKERLVDLENINTDLSLSEFLSDYGDLLAPCSHSLDLVFPADFLEVLLYVQNNSKSVSREIGTSVQQRSDNEDYFVFYDAEKELYGIADSTGNVVIPANYNDLSESGSLYFNNREKKAGLQGFYLNVIQKKLEPLPKGLTYNSTLSDGLAIFQNEERLRGVLLNNAKEIVPFVYDAIGEAGNMLVARSSLRGRNFYEFFRKDGTKLDLPRIKEFSETFNKKFIIASIGRAKWGAINADGKQTIPFEYYSLTDLHDNLFKYDTRRGLTYGLISAYGKVITEPIFREIDKFSEGLASVEMKEGGEIKQGYINEKGVVVIIPQFYRAGDFVDGNALVSHGWRRECQLIDKKGDIVKEFSKDVEIEAVRDDFGLRILYYESSDGEKYTTKGELLK